MRRALVKRLRGEEGIAMITAVIFLFVMLGVGAALMVTAGSQQRSSLNQQSGETAYSLAEAALNAQLFALSQGWPTKADASSSTAPSYGYPTSCNAASNGTSYCPTAGDLSTYPSGGTCPTGTQGDAWSSGSATNGWTTYVRDAGSSSSSSWSLFSDGAEQSAAPLDASGSGALWIRSVGIVNCHIAVLVTKVAEQVVPMSFPDYVLNANSFSTGNNGQNKDIVNTEDTSGNTSPISLRCAGSTYGNGAQPPNSQCNGVGNAGQIEPSTVWASPPAGTPTLSTSQLTALQKLAQANGTYYGPNNCNFSNPSATGASNGGLAGSPVYITGPCNGISLDAVDINGPVVNNACSTYGFIILANGTMTIGGNSTLCGVIYAPNLGSTSGNVITLQGTATVIGGLNVDGNAALNLGDSGNGVINCTDTSREQKCGDLEFSLAAFENLDGFAGVDAAPNSFRQLPNNQ
jgi:Tfp pilus assembly protein PilX